MLEIKQNNPKILLMADEIQSGLGRTGGLTSQSILYKKIKPDVLIKSHPYNAKEIVGSDLVSEKYICPKKIDISTTSILEKYKN
jgi:4-aminobutyrate aminotransferase-like enzyme